MESGAWAGGRDAASRLVLAIADGCRVCLALDSVEGVFEAAECDRPGSGPGEPADSVTLPGGPSVPVVRWSEVAEVPPPASGAASRVLVVRTPDGRVGLGAESWLGFRDAALGTASLMPTRLVGERGEPWCFVHLLEGKPYFLIDPRALARAVRRRAGTGAGAPPTTGDGRPADPSAEVG